MFTKSWKWRKRREKNEFENVWKGHVPGKSEKKYFIFANSLFPLNTYILHGNGGNTNDTEQTQLN